MKLNSRKKGTLVINGLLGNLGSLDVSYRGSIFWSRVLGFWGLGFRGLYTDSVGMTEGSYRDSRGDCRGFS